MLEKKRWSRVGNFVHLQHQRVKPTRGVPHVETPHGPHWRYIIENSAKMYTAVVSSSKKNLISALRYIVRKIKITYPFSGFFTTIMIR